MEINCIPNNMEKYMVHGFYVGKAFGIYEQFTIHGQEFREIGS